MQIAGFSESQRCAKSSANSKNPDTGRSHGLLLHPRSRNLTDLCLPTATSTRPGHRQRRALSHPVDGLGLLRGPRLWKARWAPETVTWGSHLGEGARSRPRSGSPGVPDPLRAVGQVQVWLPFSPPPLSSRRLVSSRSPRRGLADIGSGEKREVLPPGEPRGWLWGAEGSPLLASVPPSDPREMIILSSQYLSEPTARKHPKQTHPTPPPPGRRNILL